MAISVARGRCEQRLSNICLVYVYAVSSSGVEPDLSGGLGAPATHTRDTLFDLERVTFPKVNIGDRSRCRLMPFGSRCQPTATRKDASVVGQGEGELGTHRKSSIPLGYRFVSILFPDTFL